MEDSEQYVSWQSDPPTIATDHPGRPHLGASKLLWSTIGDNVIIVGQRQHSSLLLE